MCVGSLVVVFFQKIVAVSVAFGLSAGDGENSSEAEAALFEEKEFQDICVEFLALPDVAKGSFFGTGIIASIIKSADFLR